ncbi:N-acetylglucosamine-6-phosphate deacetylase [Paenibacillus rhizophilus]|uniref:N-acetylglucosamine-6-phosphate deacetylase n=1 Tax=Paenibacillus rhizophilus TaxID=1850366 RepID=A0A3N9Q4C2_9BACL|nr:N-acetylglucosamine-6-phosphate deacetylase [Paenibacillus rhizophilus]RQW12366.1 N-acetylglucosamine-6-phosphate deacetylase [Paenibacillus rhizophilus]
MAEVNLERGQLLYGIVLTPEGIVKNGAIAVQDGIIIYAGEAQWLPEACSSWPESERVQDGLLIPGFVDVHVHGGAGHDFMYADAKGVSEAAAFHASNGTTTMLVTTMTASKEAIDRVLAVVNAYRSEDMPYAQVAGVHLEGPFISPKWPGAQNPEHIVPPNVEWLEEWERSYPGLIRQVTLAPEREGAEAAITWLRRRGITAALGHTDAAYEQVIAAADAGLNQAVHTFNQMTPLHHRKPGTAGAVLSDERIRAEVIADGIHVHPAAISILVRLKGPEGLILITDAMSAAGLSDGEYAIGDLPVKVQDGVARLRDNPDALAGSTLTMIKGFRYLIQEAGLTLEDASRAASLNPAISLGMERSIGSLETGKRADILLLDGALNLRGVWIGGRRQQF